MCVSYDNLCDPFYSNGHSMPILTNNFDRPLQIRKSFPYMNNNYWLSNEKTSLHKKKLYLFSQKKIKNVFISGFILFHVFFILKDPLSCKNDLPSVYCNTARKLQIIFLQNYNNHSIIIVQLHNK